VLGAESTFGVGSKGADLVGNAGTGGWGLDVGGLGSVGFCVDGVVSGLGGTGKAGPGDGTAGDNGTFGLSERKGLGFGGSVFPAGDNCFVGAPDASLSVGDSVLPTGCSVAAFVGFSVVDVGPKVLLGDRAEGRKVRGAVVTGETVTDAGASDTRLDGGYKDIWSIPADEQKSSTILST
jgi:hypothetical protein